VIANQRTESKKTMITQQIKNWLRRVFSWWPARHQTSPVGYRHDSGTLRAVAPPDAATLSALEGTSPQIGSTSTSGTANTTPYFSTIEERPASTVLTPSPANDDTTTPHPVASGSPTDNSAAPGQTMPAPTAQQRLEFLRYLVKQGIINEGNTEK
jgi:hypothetical protein